MEKIILAVINDWSSADYIVAKSRDIAAAVDGRVSVYCPVSSELEELNRYVGFENIEQIKTELIAECETRLEALPGIADLETEVEWQSTMYRGVSERAEREGVEMIVMARSPHSIVGDFLHKPDDWHLLRDAPCPVLILNREPSQYRAVVAALDALTDSDEHQDLNARVLDEAKLLAEFLNLPLSVVSVVPEPAYVYPEVAAAGSNAISQFREDAIAAARDRQRKILGRLGVTPHSSMVTTGRIEAELQKVVSEYGLLVIGTIANKGIKGFFIGNTAERLLSYLQGDMLVVN